MDKDSVGGLRHVVRDALHIVRERILQELGHTHGSGTNEVLYTSEDKKQKIQVATDTDKADKSKPYGNEYIAKCILDTDCPVKVMEKVVLPYGVKEEVGGTWVTQTLSTLLHVAASSSATSTLPSSSSSLPTNYDVLASALLDYTWQKLNTGHWQDVALSWRWVFTWGSVALVGFLLQQLQATLDLQSAVHTSDHLTALTRVVRACDRGLIMGAPIDDNPLHSTASTLNTYARLPMVATAEDDEKNEKAPITQHDIATVSCPLPSVHCPPLDRFLLHYMTSKVPVKLQGVVDHWPALKLWNISYLRQIAGARTVPVEVGARYTDLTWSQALMTLDDYLTTYVTSPTSNTPIGYLAQHQLLDQVPQLQEDILVPDYCHLGEEPPRLHAWLGPRGTVSPLHHDPDHNILVQIMGYKYIRLYGEEQSQLVYPHLDPLLANTSQADVEGPEEDWPLLKKAQYSDLILAPGEALYIPPRCWHYVRSLSTSFSVSFWWK